MSWPKSRKNTIPRKIGQARRSSGNSFKKLIVHSSTLRQYAVLSANPDTRLSEMLRATSASQSSTKELDEMYMHILKYSIIEACDEDKEDIERLFKQIVGSIITLIDTLSTTALTRLLAVSSNEMKQTLEPLHSLLDIPQDETSPIKLCHLSFRDSLVDKNRCPDLEFWIDEKIAHNELFVRCLKLMLEHLTKDMCDLRLPGALAAKVEKSKLEKHLPLELQYACRYWVQHLQKSGLHLYDNGAVHMFLQEHLLHWFEALSLIEKTSESILAITVLESIIKEGKGAESPQLYAFIHDAKRFALTNRSIIETTPLQLYHNIFGKELVGPTFTSSSALSCGMG
jgi:hypothetical protein